jgi:hypothetical protein
MSSFTAKSHWGPNSQERGLVLKLVWLFFMPESQAVCVKKRLRNAPKAKALLYERSGPKRRIAQARIADNLAEHIFRHAMRNEKHKSRQRSVARLTKSAFE